MVTSYEAKLIAEYERLRKKLFELYAKVIAIDERLTELERLLPEKYVYPGDLPRARKRKRC